MTVSGGMQCGMSSAGAFGRSWPSSTSRSAAGSSFQQSSSDFPEGGTQMVSLRGHKRREFSQKVKGLALRRCMRNGKPHCENCGVALNARTGTIFEHLIPDGLGGEPTLENCGVWCRTCADIKTVSEDQPRMAKADRVMRANFGMKRRKGPPMPGSRQSRWKRKIDGSVVER